ncbi:MAG: hypothetical protein LUH57_02610 [Ruminococcus sp.]|nr:hypothetical protein [Ruminococcus sp.]
MKYFGTAYLGNIDAYDMKKLSIYNDPYEALTMANSEWDSDPEKQIARLLIVLRKGETPKESVNEDKAYFQFTDSQACKQFVESKKEIVWSRPENQKWNGNSKLMR